MKKRDPKNLKQSHLTFSDIVPQIWNTEGVLVQFLCPPNRVIHQTPDELDLDGYRYERAISKSSDISALVRRIENEVGDCPFVIVDPDGKSWNPRHVPQCYKFVGPVRKKYQNYTDFYKAR